MEKKQLNEMFENLLHIGNKTNYWDPKMKSYIYGSVNGIHVINLVKTSEKIEEVKSLLKELHTSGKKILFVGTKLQARDAVERIATESGHFYVTEKWVPGLLTNFKTIKRRIATYLQLSKDMESGTFDVLTKKEKASKMLELEKLEKAYRWVKDMKRVPEVIFIVDSVYEDQAVREANSLKLTSFAISSTNGDDTLVNYMIPANTNAVTSIEYILEQLKESISWKVIAPQAWPRNRTEWTRPSRFKKIDDKKISGEKKAPTVKKAWEVKVEEVKAEEVKEAPAKATTPKAPAKTATKKVEETKVEEVKVEEVKEEAPKKAPAKATTPKAPAKTATKKAEETKVEEVKEEAPKKEETTEEEK